MKLKDCKISEYTFSSLSGSSYGSDGIDLYSFSPLSGAGLIEDNKSSESINNERRLAHNNSFNIMSEVKKGRGIEEQENKDREEIINKEIERRLSAIKETAFEEGYNDGWESGKQKVVEASEKEVEDKIDKLASIVEEAFNYKLELIDREKDKIYRLINSLVKWITLRELEGDGDYINRLLEKLILESKSKSNILIKVDSSNFDKMTEVLSTIESKMGELENTRVEIDYNIKGPGIILDTDNGIIDSTLKEQFNALDKLFGSVGLDDIEGADISEYLDNKELGGTSNKNIEDKVEEPKDGNE